MRQLLIQVPCGQGERAIEIARGHQGTNMARWDVSGDAGPREVVLIHVSNRKVEGLLADLEPIPDLRVTLAPRGVMALQPPPDEAAEQVTEVEDRSPVEVFLSGLQSIGSWRGLLSYAALAGVVVWIGLFTNTSYLLVAAMLIAPYAGPAMAVAMGTARGDWALLKRSTGRYFTSLGVTIAANALLTLALRQEIATEQMVRTSEVSTTAVLLPLAAGAAGAVNLVQSERSSLVSGAAVGMAVAASLAPPAGVVGMAGAIGRWDMVGSAVFLLLLQLLAINLAGALVFRAFGLTPSGARYARGEGWILWTAMGVTAAALAGVLWLQFGGAPELQRATLAQRAATEVRDVVETSGLAHLVEANVRFTRAEIPGQNALLAVVYVQRREGIGPARDAVEARLGEAIRARIRERMPDVTPLVNVTALGG